MLELDKLNEAQRKAVTYGEGPLLVLAGPGSGKTFTITQRIFYLLSKGVPPEEILVITFTKEAAKSMQERFLKQSRCIYPVNFGTFHSVFYHILKQSNVLSNQKLLTAAQKKNLLIPILKKIQKNKQSGENVKDEALEILSAVGFFKNTNNEKAAREKLGANWQPFFSQIFQEYENARKKAGAIDFDDMLYECQTLLKRIKAFREYWQNRFSYILIDEFQDINPVQYEIVKLLLKPPFSLFAVGDDDQAIYGFRGSSPSCLKQFAEEYGAGQILLNVNYRSYEEIIEASLLVIGENKERFPKCLEASLEHRRPALEKKGVCYPEAAKAASLRPREGVVELHAFESRGEQYDALTEQLKRAEGKSCVLFRTNLLMQSFAVRLKKAGIPYEMKEKSQSIYEHFIAKDILAYLQLAAVYGREAESGRKPEDSLLDGRTKRELLLQILNKPSRYISREALGGGEPDFQKIAAYYEKNDKCVEKLKQLEKHIKYLQNASLKTAVQYIRKAVGYEKYLQEAAGRDGDKLQEWQEYLAWLAKDASTHDTLKAWMEAQKRYDAELAEQRKRKERAKENASPVQLMTVHASKGLEFDNVYLPDCNEKVFPHGTMPDVQACEEERRIFYVAMTRAKKSLKLLCVTGTRERPRLPSRFLNPLWKKYYSSTSSSNSQLSRYSSKASATFSYSSSSSIKDNSGSSLESSGFSL